MPLYLVNGRMSPRSERRYKRLRWLSRQVFNKLSLVCAQSPEDANNFAAVTVHYVPKHGNMAATVEIVP